MGLIIAFIILELVFIAAALAEKLPKASRSWTSLSGG